MFRWLYSSYTTQVSSGDNNESSLIQEINYKIEKQMNIAIKLIVI